MAVKNKAIEPKELVRILRIEEGHFVELKRVEIRPAKLTDFVSAFANTSGGELFIGIAEDDGPDNTKVLRWAGFPNIEAANAHLAAVEAMAPLGGHYDATFLSADGQPGVVLHLLVFKTRDILRASDGMTYVRRGAQKQPVDTEEGLQRLRLDKGIATFEDQTLDVPIDLVSNSEVVIRFMLDVVPSAEPDEWLRKQILLVNGKPTVAAALLFAEEPQTLLPKRSAIKVYRYRTKENQGTRDTLAGDPITIEGCLYDQIKSAVARTKAIVEEMKQLGERSLEDIQYPHETLHEIITNAVLHRDYSIAADVHVRIFDNRIEVESPGRLPGHVTTDNILREQSARNPKLVRLINKFPDPPNKDVGEGLNTAFEAMKKLRLREPQIDERENGVVVYIHHAPLASAEEAVMGYLKTNPSITNSAARELTGIGSENKMKRVFLALNEAKMIERVPGKMGKSAAWQLYTGTTDVAPDEGEEQEAKAAESPQDSGDAVAFDPNQLGLFEPKES
jgi:ATP-dependent DNA helicase RecG